MPGPLTAEITRLISASPAAVWKTITSPQLVKEYLFGTEVSSGWKKGDEIRYRGEYNGKSYEDKGRILDIEPQELFRSTYWSSMGGKEDKPENYNVVTYKLKGEGGSTRVTLTQDNIASEEEKQHMIANWSAVLDKLGEVAESVK